MPTATPFEPIYRQDLSAVVLSHSNGARIADKVMPRAKSDSVFSYQEFVNGIEFTAAGGEISRTGDVPQVDFQTKPRTDKTKDYALEAPVVVSEKKKVSFNHESTTSNFVADCLSNQREIRVAQMTFDKANYNHIEKFKAEEIKTSLGEKLLKVLDKPLQRPNSLILGQGEWTQLRTCPALVRWVNANNGGDGAITKEQLAEKLEIKQVLVGESRINNVNPLNRQPAITRVWQNHAAFLYIDDGIKDLDQIAMTWGITAESLERCAIEFMTSQGQLGTQWIRVAESLNEIIISKECGILIQDLNKALEVINAGND